MESSYEIFNKVIKQALRTYWGHPEYEDMYQECYLKILEVLSKTPYEPIYNLHGYTYCIARNAISNYMYKYKKKPITVDEEFQEVKYEESFLENLYIQEIFTDILEKYHDSLPKGYNEEDLYELILGPDPKNIKLRIIKGDTLWKLGSYLDQKN